MNKHLIGFLFTLFWAVVFSWIFLNIRVWMYWPIPWWTLVGNLPVYVLLGAFVVALRKEIAWGLVVFCLAVLGVLIPFAATGVMFGSLGGDNGIVIASVGHHILLRLTWTTIFFANGDLIWLPLVGCLAGLLLLGASFWLERRGVVNESVS